MIWNLLESCWHDSLANVNLHSGFPFPTAGRSPYFVKTYIEHLSLKCHTPKNEQRKVKYYFNSLKSTGSIIFSRWSYFIETEANLCAEITATRPHPVGTLSSIHLCESTSQVGVGHHPYSACWAQAPVTWASWILQICSPPPPRCTPAKNVPRRLSHCLMRFFC